jgi:hypothetical protein
MDVDHECNRHIVKHGRRTFARDSGDFEGVDNDCQNNVHHQHGDDGEVGEEEKGADERGDEIKLLPRPEFAHADQHEIDYTSIERRKLPHLRAQKSNTSQEFEK